MENITTVEKQDLSLIQIIEDDAFPSPWQPSDFENMLSGGCHFLKICREGQLLGFAILHIGFPNCDLFKLAIHPDHRSGGLGKQLVDHCIELVKSSGETFMLLNARVGDERAMSFYLDLGFTGGAVLPDYYKFEVDGEPRSADALVMTLNF